MLYRNDLDLIWCQGAIVLQGRCHPEYPAWCLYEDGALVLRCSKCNGVTAVISVGDDKYRNIPSA